MEGKWFADSIDGAYAHGDRLYPNGVYRVIEAKVPNDARSLFRMKNLDGLGPARYLDVVDLEGVIARLHRP